MQLTKSRHAARLAEIALSELEAIVSDPWSGGQASQEEIEMRMDLRLNEALAMVRRVGSILDDETRGKRTPSFGLWWQKTGQEDLYKDVNQVRNLEFKGGDRSPDAGTTVIFQYNEAEPAGRTTDPRVILESDPFGVIDLLRQYLSWCQLVLIPGAEQRTL